MYLIPVFLGILLLLGIIEKRKHHRNRHRIPVRININGIRGKSTVTRLTTGIMVHAGLKTVGKTTGTAARVIYWDRDEERPIKRRLEGPNIREQRLVIEEAAALGAECLVSECMAVNPDYQVIFQDEFMQANVGVIVNVLEDHMDVLGPTLQEVAQAFTATIPYNGKLIVSDGPFVDFFTQEATKRNTEIFVAQEDRISEEYLKRFGYIVFPQNAALALTIAEALGISEEKALEGMLKAHPDPGALRVWRVNASTHASYFVNGFAANDAESTKNIWKRIQELGYPTQDPIVIMNCRADRVDRTEQFARDVLPYISIGCLILIGNTTSPIVQAYERGEIQVHELLDLEDRSTSEIFRVITERLTDGERMVYGVGNIHGAAEPICAIFETTHQRIQDKLSKQSKKPQIHLEQLGRKEQMQPVG